MCCQCLGLQEHQITANKLFAFQAFIWTLIFFGKWKIVIVWGSEVCILVVKTFSKAAAERLRLIKRQLRLTSD